MAVDVHEHAEHPRRGGQGGLVVGAANQLAEDVEGFGHAVEHDGPQGAADGPLPQCGEVGRPVLQLADRLVNFLGHLGPSVALGPEGGGVGEGAVVGR